MQINLQTFYDNTGEDLIDFVKRLGNKDCFEDLMNTVIADGIADKGIFNAIISEVPSAIQTRIDKYFENIEKVDITKYYPTEIRGIKKKLNL